MKKIVALCSLKGGTGKTASTMALAAASAMAGRKTLLIDLDPQANASIGLGIDPSELQSTIGDVIVDNAPMKDAIVETGLADLALVGSNIRLAIDCERLYTRVYREKILSKAIRAISKSYELIFIDCAPSLNILTVNALFAADYVLMPCQTSRYGLDGVGDLLDQIQEIKGTSESVGIVLTQYDARNKRTNEWVQDQLAPVKKILCKTIINRSESINQAIIVQKNIFDYAPKSRGAQDYKKLSQEIWRTLKND